MQLAGREVSGIFAKEKEQDLQPTWNMRSRFENDNEGAWSDGEGEKEEVRCEVVHRQEESRVSEEFHVD